MSKKSFFVIAILVIMGGIGTLIILHQKKLPEVTKISSSNPFAIEIKRERSFFQAEKIKNRLRDQGLPTYIMALEDSMQSGQWYSIMAEATVDTTAIDSITQYLKARFNLDSLFTVDFRDSTNTFVDTDTLKIAEKKRIHESIPLIPASARSIIYHFPNTDFFYIKDFKLVNFLADSVFQGEWYDSITNHVDLPRGLSLRFLPNIADAWGEVIYIDNLYGDQVTIDILHLRPEMAFLPDSAQSQADSIHFRVAAFLGQKILDTGKYPVEQKYKMSIREKDPLRGYRIIIEPQTNHQLTYIILVDANKEFAYFCQSAKKSLTELISILELINQGEGIDEYDEFHNTFFIMPSILPEEDNFVSFQLSKLDWSYAKSKNNTLWSKQMVGHWSSKTWYANATDKSIWTSSLFDLLTPEKLKLIYHKYYAGERTKEEATEVYGTAGYYVGEYELNFGYDRYLASIDDQNYIKLEQDKIRTLVSELISSGEYSYLELLTLLMRPEQFYKKFATRLGVDGISFSLADLKDRANRMQFFPGGYSTSENILVADK